MNNYFDQLEKIQCTFSILDEVSYETREEAEEGMKKYEELMDKIVQIIIEILADKTSSNSVYKEAVKLLGSKIGCADDVQKYGDIMKSFYDEGRITQGQLSFFIENINIGRWI